MTSLLYSPEKDPALFRSVEDRSSSSSIPIPADLALHLLSLDPSHLRQAASAVRDDAWGKTVTWSPKAFLPLTNLCRNRCDYCSFRKNPQDPQAHTMDPQEVESICASAHDTGCIEALFCLGDSPESFSPAYRRLLQGWGHHTTPEYLASAARAALAAGLLPHTNAGLLSPEAMALLRPVNVSLGLMLETASLRLMEPGMAHARAPDKHPHRRLAMMEAAGEMKIPFTTGILVGIGETAAERVESLLAIRALHQRHQHIQEVIVQNFRAHPRTPAASWPDPEAEVIAETVALARLLLPDEVSVQSPPNLNPHSIPLLLNSGINDFGGISPLTPDYINLHHPWPQISSLRTVCHSEGFRLQPRLPIYPRYMEKDSPWIDDSLVYKIAEVQTRMLSPYGPSHAA